MLNEAHANYRGALSEVDRERKWVAARTKTVAKITAKNGALQIWGGRRGGEGETP